MSAARLHALFSKPEEPVLNGVVAANKKVAECTPEHTIIFLTKSEYEDLIFRACLPELKSYKGKQIWIISDAVDEQGT